MNTFFFAHSQAICAKAKDKTHYFLIIRNYFA